MPWKSATRTPLNTLLVAGRTPPGHEAAAGLRSHPPDIRIASASHPHRIRIASAFHLTWGAGPTEKEAVDWTETGARKLTDKRLQLLSQRQFSVPYWRTEMCAYSVQWLQKIKKQETKTMIALPGLQSFASNDPKMRRVVRYWGLTVALYSLCLVALWVEAVSGAARIRDAAGVTALACVGQFAFYVMIRLGDRVKITPAQLSEYQGRFAVLCGVLGYAFIGPFRGSTLVFFVVILVFCAFTLPAPKSRQLSIFAVTLLGLAMIVMTRFDPAVDGVQELKNFVMVGSAILVVGYLTGRLTDLREALVKQKKELTQALERIQELADHDGLTGLPNRRKMSEVLMAEETGKPDRLCLALLDIDRFKDVNDTYGHAIGDHVLQDFARHVPLVLRPQDILSRWGGEEFLLYLPGTTLETAKGIIERVRDQVGKCLFEEAGHRIRITCSAGLVEVAPSETVEAAISRADSLLYRAKKNGRDRFEC